MSGRRGRGALAKRALLGLVALGAALFALEGGEYGTTDLVRQGAEKRQLEAEIRILEREVDSLTRVKRMLASNAAEQERIAREEFGMVRGDKEVLYRFAEPASGGGPPQRRPPRAR